MPPPPPDAVRIALLQNVPAPDTKVGAGTAFTVITTVLTAAAHGGPDGLFVVSVKVTVPDAIVGVYVEVKEFTLENVPLGALHVEVVALPPMLPASVIVPPAHTDCGKPALSVGGVRMVTVALPCVPQQPAPDIELK